MAYSARHPHPHTGAATVAKRSGRTRTTTRARRRAPAAVPAVVTVRAAVADGIVSTSISRKAGIVRLAEEWTYILRSRARWLDDQERRESFRDRALTGLNSLGITREQIAKFATAHHGEVELHDWDVRNTELNRIHEAASELPWEYLISAATRALG